MGDDLEELIGLREVLRAEGCSRSTLYERMRRGEFPHPLPNATGISPSKWVKSEVLAHQRVRLAKLREIASSGQRVSRRDRSISAQTEAPEPVSVAAKSAEE